MKKLIIAVAFMSCSVFAAYHDRVPEAENQRLNREAEGTLAEKLAIFREADAVEIREMPEGEKRVRVVDAAAIRSAVARLAPDFSERVWYRGKQEDEFYTLSVPCQCWGEFEFTFFKGEGPIGKFTTFHLRDIKDERLTGGVEERLQLRALELLCELAALHFDGAKQLLAEMKKPNKQPQQQSP